MQRCTYKAVEHLQRIHLPENRKEVHIGKYVSTKIKTFL